jgi:Kef-type K+ transport system membrane component KefB
VICTVLRQYRKTGFGYFLPSLILSSYATEVMVFMPFWCLYDGFYYADILNSNDIYRKVEDVAVILLLPCFFVFTGLKTEIGLINDPFMGIAQFAVVGKFLGSAVAANLLDRTGRQLDNWCLDEHKG